MQVWQKTIHSFKRYLVYKTMTLKKRLRSPKTYITCLKPTTVIFSCRSGGYPSIGSKHISFLGEKLTFIKLTFDLDKG